MADVVTAVSLARTRKRTVAPYWGADADVVEAGESLEARVARWHGEGEVGGGVCADAVGHRFSLDAKRPSGGIFADGDTAPAGRGREPALLGQAEFAGRAGEAGIGPDDVVARDAIAGIVGHEVKRFRTGDVHVEFHALAGSVAVDDLGLLELARGLVVLAGVEEGHVFIGRAGDVGDPGDEAVGGAEELAVVLAALIDGEDLVVGEEREREVVELGHVAADA